ncbi:MAG TPA: ABC transporter substrate-binding protein [Galbitalea sp.]
MKRLLVIVATCATVVALTGCSSQPDSSGPHDIVVGFSQVGAENGWRTANTNNIQFAFKSAGITLRFSDAEQRQDNQIAAIRSYIQQRVSVIAFSPVVETGWDTVLEEARAAHIPVVLTDRSISTKDPSLYTTLIGSNFLLEGERAGSWASKEFAKIPQVNYLEIDGTTGAAPTIDRKIGFDKAIAGQSNFTKVAEQDGDFTRAGGEQVMEAELKAHPNINFVFAQNDDMALGAIQAIKAAGEVPGKDIKIVSVDATHDGMEALAAGKINFIVECSPLLGHELAAVVQDIVAKKKVPRRMVTNETTFTRAQAIAALPTRKY